MSTTTASREPRKTGLFAALLSANADKMLAYNAVEEVRDMAGENIDAKFEAVNTKFEAQNAKFEAQNAKIDALRWMTGGLYLFIPIAMGVLALILKS